MKSREPQSVGAAVMVSVCLLLAATGCSDSRQESASPLELERIREADQAYATAWLANDREQVMATLTPDAVLVPSGLPVVEGGDAIRQFWWPEGSPATKVTKFTLVQHEVEGHGDMGFIRGSFSLRFAYDGDAYSGRGEYFSVLRRDASSWRISHRMWSDRPAGTDD